ncbi:TadE family protein [Ureibacillus acetophenoni]|uniref:TadE-like protein n=1 Tax=Ureibacillus acetophenoni TaxID=614649 RepID=A0A285U5N1_9BACL|nr:TadE family protein [Ureibacillus acetophenoni]SOC37260.1 TadE-like protein [Ureibacillus acetophenoni]
MKSEKGASIVEFALILPLLILLVFGIIDFGRIFHAYLTIDHAGREAARVASVGKFSDVETTAVQKSGNMITAEDVEVTYSDVNKIRGSIATVKIDYKITFLTPIIQPFFPSGLTLSDTTTMRIE